MFQKLPKTKQINFNRLGKDFFRCYFGDKPDISITELAKILGIGGQRKWGRKFLAWIQMWELDCIVKKGYVRVTPEILTVWFERECNRRN